MNIAQLKKNNKNINNHFIICINNKKYLKSYNNIVTLLYNDKICLSSMWNYSKTTTKYILLFLQQNGYDYNCKNDIIKAINSSDIIIDNILLTI